MHASTLYVCSIYVAFINKFPHTHFFAFLLLVSSLQFTKSKFYLSIHYFKLKIKLLRLIKGRVLWLVFRDFALYNLLIGLWFSRRSYNFLCFFDVQNSSFHSILFYCYIIL